MSEPTARAEVNVLRSSCLLARGHEDNKFVAAAAAALPVGRFFGLAPRAVPFLRKVRIEGQAK